MGVWAICLLSILAILCRPWQISEWVWATIGACALVLTRLIPTSVAVHALEQGTDVYLFLLGMMLLSELARSEGVFSWLADYATSHARRSSARLFILIYSVGIVVTALLSNDATAVVMTPAVYAAVKKAGAKPLPYLFACAMIANAASFLLPISNPANLVVYGGHLPPIRDWIQSFGLPSLGAIAGTFGVLWWWFRRDLRGELTISETDEPVNKLSAGGKFCLGGILLVIVVLFVASWRSWQLGAPTLAAAAVVTACIAVKHRAWPMQVLRNIAWGVVPLVGGLFVIVEAMNAAGALRASQEWLAQLKGLSPLLQHLSAAFGVGALSNVINNLPTGLIAGLAVQTPDIAKGVRDAVLIGVDLGPNLSVTGSLATILWLMALRREGERVSGFAFFKVGLLAMPVALGLAVILL